ncbi:aminodeoxychorismate synthase component I [Acinetobacter sp. ANC 5054]|uniref:anthranilate synthase component I family protein n=1 Tax=Acinetobacter sp. ANC 5054 TaxID=1977877 RepID=UPI000A3421A7|nr:anthranilate synthase component I family protein [Acinetobacter sp. ANC 5054]OTG80595.1 aminodeoxychorismate synthase component I [Acinetobacter sp. ANC 5054]
MSNLTIYKKLILPSHVSAQSILQALNELTHVIFLQDIAQPVIGLLSTYCQIISKGELKTYVRQDLQTYIECNDARGLNFNFNNRQDSPNTGFTGGVMGFIGYDFAAKQRIQLNTKDQPNLFLGDFQSYLKLEAEGWTFYSHEAIAHDIYEHVLQLLHKNSTHSTSFGLTTICQARWNKAQYQHAFDQVQEYIKAGDCYQINLTQEFTASAQGRLLDTAEQFWTLTNAPYAGYLRIDNFELLSCSPELFIDFAANRKIITKPIKGTMPRFDDPIRDAESKQKLQDSKKDQAENVMIVDLLRNDLSVYAETGSVNTPKLFNIESFNQVHHMVSEVEATLKAEVNPFEMLLSALPGGSITGAPKIRAMQIIEELEGAPRGAYCGSLGYFNEDGTGSWNILIRSIQKYQNDVSIWAGGGITIASDCDAEYQECFDKVEAMLNLLNTWYTPE